MWPQIIGIYQRAGDLDVNACKKKQATNIRRCSICGSSDRPHTPTPCMFCPVLPFIMLHAAVPAQPVVTALPELASAWMQCHQGPDHRAV